MQEQVQQLRAAVRELSTLTTQASSLQLDSAGSTAGGGKSGGAASASAAQQHKQAKLNALYDKMCSSLLISDASSASSGNRVQVPLVQVLIEASDKTLWAVLKEEQQQNHLVSLLVDLLTHDDVRIVAATATCLDVAVCSQASAAAASVAAAGDNPFQALLQTLHQRGAFRALLPQLLLLNGDANSVGAVVRALSAVLTSLPMEDAFVWAVVQQVVVQLEELCQPREELPGVEKLSAAQQFLLARVLPFCVGADSAATTTTAAAAAGDGEDSSSTTALLLDLCFVVVENFPLSQMAAQQQQQQKQLLIRLLSQLFKIINCAFDLFLSEEFHPEIASFTAPVDKIPLDALDTTISPLHLTNFEDVLSSCCSVLRVLLADDVSAGIEVASSSTSSTSSSTSSSSFSTQQQHEVARNAVHALRSFIKRPGFVPRWLEFAVDNSTAAAGCTEVRDAALAIFVAVLRVNTRASDNFETLLNLLQGGILGVLSPLANSFAFQTVTQRRRDRQSTEEENDDRDDRDDDEYDENLERAQRLVDLTKTLGIFQRRGQQLLVVQQQQQQQQQEEGKNNMNNEEEQEQDKKRALANRITEKLNSVFTVCKSLLESHRAVLQNATKKSALLDQLLGGGGGRGNEKGEGEEEEEEDNDREATERATDLLKEVDMALRFILHHQQQQQQ